MRSLKPVDIVPDGGGGGDSEERLRALTVAELRGRGAPRWLIRNILQQHAIAVVWGASQSGKTFIVLDMAAAIARGERWFDQRVGAGGVIYVAGEGHLRHRVAALMEQKGLDNADLARLRIIAANVNLLAVGADLLPLVASLKRAAAEIGGVALVVLDTLNAMMPGGDENSSEDMGAMIGAARMVAEQLGCAVLYVHHCGKDEDRGARGHSSLRAAIDTEIVVKNNAGQRTLRVEKQRDGETGIEMAFTLRPVDLGPSEDPEADSDERESSCIVEASATAAPAGRQPKIPKGTDTALRALREAVFEYGDSMPGTSAVPPGVKATTLGRWRDRAYLFDPIDDPDAAKGREAQRKRFTRARIGLQEAGAIGVLGELVWLNA